MIRTLFYCFFFKASIRLMEFIYNIQYSTFCLSSVSESCSLISFILFWIANNSVSILSASRDSVDSSCHDSPSSSSGGSSGILSFFSLSSSEERVPRDVLGLLSHLLFLSWSFFSSFLFLPHLRMKKKKNHFLPDQKSLAVSSSYLIFS